MVTVVSFGPRSNKRISQLVDEFADEVKLFLGETVYQADKLSMPLADRQLGRIQRKLDKLRNDVCVNIIAEIEKRERLVVIEEIKSGCFQISIEGHGTNRPDIGVASPSTAFAIAAKYAAAGAEVEFRFLHARAG